MESELGSLLVLTSPSSSLSEPHFSPGSCLRSHFPKAPSLPDTKSLQSQSQTSGLAWYQGRINTLRPVRLGLALCSASLCAPPLLSPWIRIWVSSSTKHHSSFSLPNPHGSPQLCIARRWLRCGGDLPGPSAPLASSLTPSPLSQPGAGCSVQPSPCSRSGGSPDLFFQPTPLWHL